jgi:hypothetical protein
MEIFTYLVITPVYKNSYSDKPYRADLKLVKSVKGTSMASNAVPIKLALEIPDELFSKPQLQATIKIDKNKVSAPVIDAEVLDNITEMINKQLGVDLKINLVTKEK